MKIHRLKDFHFINIKNETGTGIKSQKTKKENKQYGKDL